MSHPWELTLQQLLHWLQRERGIEVKKTVSVNGIYLKRGLRIHFLPPFDEDEVLPIPILYAICNALDLPYLDLGLDPRDGD